MIAIRVPRIAIYIQANDRIDFTHADPRDVVGKDLASASGFKMVHQSVAERGGD